MPTVNRGGAKAALPKVKTVEWLHLSDFHFHSTASQPRDRVLKSLCADLEESISNGWKPDFVAVTGDLAYSGDPDQLSRAWDYLRRILAICNLPKQQLFVVPGNHDVNRSAHQPTLLRALREARSPEEYAKVSAEFGLLEVQQLLTKRLSAYREFSRKLPKRRWLTEDKLWFVDTVTGAGGATVAVAGLTSCWASGEDREDQLRYLAVGQFQTRPALEALKQIPADVRIVMLHHPLECLQLQDERALKGDLRGACDILLRGHLHDNVLNVTSDPDWGFATLAAGSAYETEWTRNGYLLTRANIHDRRVVLMVSARRWSAEGAFFCADVGTYFQGRNTGIFELELSRND